MRHGNTLPYFRWELLTSETFLICFVFDYVSPGNVLCHCLFLISFYFHFIMVSIIVIFVIIFNAMFRLSNWYFTLVFFFSVPSKNSELSCICVNKH